MAERRFLVEAGFPLDPELLTRVTGKTMAEAQEVPDTYIFNDDGGVTVVTPVSAQSPVQAIVRATPVLYGMLSNLDSERDFRELAPYKLTVFDNEETLKFWRGDHLNVTTE